MVILDPSGDGAVGLELVTMLPGPTLLTVTVKPAACNWSMAWCAGMPSTLGTATIGGPGEKKTLTTSCGKITLPAAGDCLTIVSSGALLEATWVGLIVYPPADAAACAAETCPPTKFGSGCPALTVIATGLFFGHMVPATGLVAVTIPAGTVVDGTWLTAPGVRPRCFSADWAPASGRPVTGGTAIWTGPSDSMIVTGLPALALAPVAGSVRITSPRGTVLLFWLVPSRTVKPSFSSSVRAVAAARPAN